MKLSHRHWRILAAAVVFSFFAAGLNVQARPRPAGLAEPQAAESKAPPRLGLPLDCRLGADCYIMHYVDVDPSPAERDFACGRQTYDGHDGTDFAIANEKTMAAGVAVVSVAAGKVLRARDGAADRRVDGADGKQAVQGVECGNGVVIDLGGGWQAQYCHLRQGSLRVKAGEPVARGAALGLVGESGLAGFPHVHLTLRHNGKIVDPFSGPDAPSGCGGDVKPLWAQPLAYVPTGLAQAGFATRAPTLGDALAGRFQETVFPADSPALLFWVHDFGVLQGDIETFDLEPPGGGPAIHQAQPIKASQRAWVSFAGQRNSPAQPLPAGTWRARYRLTRDGQALIDIRREAVLQ